MIQQFKSEFSRIAGIKDAEYTTKRYSELEEFTQSFDFNRPLINCLPLERFRSEIGASSQVIYNGTFKLQFITKAVKSDNFENVKDVLIDEMITLSEHFYRELNKNANRIFINPRWNWTNIVLRNYLSQYCVGVESEVVFNTACNRY